jgi:hypothetical protein
MYTAYAFNERTKEKIILGYYPTRKYAWWDIAHNLEWDENDNKKDWSFCVENT